MSMVYEQRAWQLQRIGGVVASCSKALTKVKMCMRSHSEFYLVSCLAPECKDGYSKSSAGAKACDSNMVSDRRPHILNPPPALAITGFLIRSHFEPMQQFTPLEKEAILNASCSWRQRPRSRLLTLAGTESGLTWFRLSRCQRGTIKVVNVLSVRIFCLIFTF